MTTVKDFMGGDHDRLDDIFQQFQKEPDVEKAKHFFKEFKTGLQRHIVWEEEILFPLFEEKTGMRDSGPTAVMRMEHRQIKEILERIHDQLKAGKKNTTFMESELLRVLGEHNDKEESILYPWIDKEVSSEKRKEAFEQMKKVPPEKYEHCCGG